MGLSILSLRQARKRQELKYVRRALKITKGNNAAAAKLLEISLRQLMYIKQQARRQGDQSFPRMDPASRVQPENVWSRIEREYWRRHNLSTIGQEWDHPKRSLYSSREAWLQQRKEWPGLL
jgi:hypothetical protein